MGIIFNTAKKAKGSTVTQGTGELAGMSFEMEPLAHPKADVRAELQAFYEKHPYRAARKGEKTATQWLREARDSR
jgi:hypothetical protein